MEIRLWAMGWRSRILFFALATLGLLLLSIALSAAWARPAAAAPLPLPAPSSLTAAVPTAVTSAGGTVGDVTNGSGVVSSITALPSNLITAVTGAAGGIAPLPTLPGGPLPTLPGGPLPTLPITSLPIPALPLPGLAVITKPATDTTPTDAAPSGTNGSGPIPGIGGAAHGSTGTHQSRSSSHGSAASGSLSSSDTGGSGAPARAPRPGSPSPSFPLLPGSAGDATAPGHGNTPWNAVPLTILLLTALGLGGVFLRRRLGLKPLFDSRLSPPG